MIIIDHAINQLIPFYEATLSDFIEAHKTGKYKRFCDNPYYAEVKALLDSLNCLYKYMGEDTIKLKDEVELYIND